MGKIITKLNLNKTPQLVDNNSLIFAKNIKLLKDGSIGPDFAIDEVIKFITSTNKYGVIGYIVGVNSKIYFFVESYDTSIERDEHVYINFPPFEYRDLYNVTFTLGYREFKLGDAPVINFSDYVIAKIKEVLGVDSTITFNESDSTYTLNIKHCISEDIEATWSYVLNGIYHHISSFKLTGTKLPTKIQILEYNELTNFINEIKCGWKYNGGKITGNVTVNNTNEEILNICEYDCPSADVPIKHINLSKCKETDDESIYTQAPNIPITNLSLITTYTKTIPNGVYQFFIRYKIRENFYTLWHPCSKECFAGTSSITKTIQGQLKNVNVKTDAGKSFVFKVEHLFDGINSNIDYTKNFINYQIGFIISHDDTVKAFSWKSFNFSVNEIYFDYDQNSITEINIDDILKTNYELFNVKNITYFKNKLYIANYKETNFNPDLSNIAKNINVTLNQINLNKDDVITIGTSQITSSGTYGNDVYDKWGGQNIIVLFHSNYYNTLSYTKTNIETIDSEDKNYGILQVTSYLNYDINPDICWINSSNSDIKNLPESYIPKFNDTNTTRFPSEYFGSRPYAWTYLYYDNLYHPFSKLPYSKYKWYWVKNMGVIKNGFTGEFSIDDAGIRESYTNCIQTWLDQFLLDMRASCPSVLLVGVYIISNGKRYYLRGNQEMINNMSDPCNFAGDKLQFFNTVSDNYLISYAQKLIADKIVGVKQDGSYVAYINNEIVTFSEYFITYSEFTYKYSGESITDSEPRYEYKYRIDCQRVNKVIAYNIAINTRYISSSYIDAQYNTLLPFTDYDFYIHYVKDNGIATNGYFIDTKQLNVYHNETGVNIIYPIFNNIKIPEGYSNCFISIYKSGNDVCKCFNHELKADGYHYLDCLEADTLLYNLNDNITIIDSSGNEIVNSEGNGGKATANYYSSGSTNVISLFGNSGCIRWAKDKNEFSYYEDIPKQIFKIDTKIPNAKLYISIKKESDAVSEITYIPFFGAWRSKLELMLDSIKKDYNDLIYELTDIIEDNEETVTTYNLSIGTKAGSITSLGLLYLEDNNDYTDEILKEHEIKANFRSNSNYDGYWIKINNKKDNDNNKQLIKLTPYLTNYDSSYFSYDEYINLNMPGYVNKVYKLNRNVANNIYVSGNDIYTKNTSTPNVIGLTEYNGFQPLADSVSAYIPSNFNLNYCSLSEDLTPQIRSFSIDNSKTQRQLIIAVQSLTSSFILELKSMYRDYIRKYYSVYDKNAINEFNNTIRSSDVNTDEMYRNIYFFEANDYYNTPTNRGIIVNMFNIVNSIYIHTEHSIFKFSNTNTLSSSDGEVSMKEGDVFDTGITEVFDAQYGYAGLQEKHQSLITFNSYVFYDSIAKVIYAYGGDNQIIKISEPIQKILETFDFYDILFVADDYNDRFFINLKSNDKNICLSYNFKVKSFVSIHDFDFNTAFNTRNSTYFINTDNNNYIIYRDNKTNYNNYGSLFTKSAISIKDMTYKDDANKNIVENCVDIIYNEDYEIIKNIDYINWICSAIINFNSDDNMAEEILDNRYSGTQLKIYSDQCSTGIIKLTDDGGNPKVQNDLSISDPNSYQYPRYNCGIWSLNYFRDVRNVNDIFNYGSHNVTQDKSLIYGKYFVARFIFKNKNFKLENINFNVRNYDKI